MRRIFRCRAVLTMLFVCAGEFSCPAEEPVRTPQGAIASFAPIVEKVAPTVVTVFTTQNVSKSVLSFPLSDEFAKGNSGCRRCRGRLCIARRAGRSAGG
jgi:S1-C subfamily serine protease